MIPSQWAEHQIPSPKRWTKITDKVMPLQPVSELPVDEAVAKC